MARQEGGGMLAHGQDLKDFSPMIKVIIISVSIVTLNFFSLALVLDGSSLLALGHC